MVKKFSSTIRILILNRIANELFKKESLIRRKNKHLKILLKRINKNLLLKI